MIIVKRASHGVGFVLLGAYESGSHIWLLTINEALAYVKRHYNGKCWVEI